ncbi:MAG: tRNA (adenosine(37)-N6)-dimethylallyltransferase MiaA [Candidatus Uhrbacteria bacterium]|nr:tRNA (adenosine(37)-N6)-dimethylallyltransferase MiaA [Candidatus Uhrbacteria bacterium]
MKPKLIAIVGPTASGKTALGIEIAKLIGGEVISVDSRMVYRGMNVGTAKPEGEWKTEEIQIGGRIDQLFGARKEFFVEDVPHWGIDLVEPDQEYSVATFKTYAEKKIAEIVKRKHIPILVGGTGLWLSAVIDNLDLSSTPSDEKLRAELEEKSLGDLFHEFKKLDPVGAEQIDRENKRRVVRALEVTLLTGKPFSQLQTRGISKYDVLQIGIAVDRETLNERINDRVDEMIAKELVTEVRSLKEKFGCTIESMTGIGYRQVCEFLEGRSSLKDAIEEIKKDSRHYAKRQMTWFKRDERIQWVKNAKEAIGFVETFLQ